MPYITNSPPNIFMIGPSSFGIAMKLVRMAMPSPVKNTPTVNASTVANS